MRRYRRKAVCARGKGATVRASADHNAQGSRAHDGGEKSRAPLGPGVAGSCPAPCIRTNALPGCRLGNGPAGANDLLKDTRFKAAYTQALGPWHANLDRPHQGPRRASTVRHRRGRLTSRQLQAHDCSDHNSLLGRPDRGQLLGLCAAARQEHLLGHRRAAARELERLWATEWRKK